MNAPEIRWLSAAIGAAVATLVVLGYPPPDAPERLWIVAVGFVVGWLVGCQLVWMVRRQATRSD